MSESVPSDVWLFGVEFGFDCVPVFVVFIERVWLATVFEEDQIFKFWLGVKGVELFLCSSFGFESFEAGYPRFAEGYRSWLSALCGVSKDYSLACDEGKLISNGHLGVVASKREVRKRKA